jgi:phosphatidylglycerophosphatase A
MMNLSRAKLKQRVFSNWRYFIGFGFGSGLLPKCPGTWGTLITIPLIYILSWFPLYFYITLTVSLFFIGAHFSHVISEELGIHDYGGVNIDEVVGFLCVMLPFHLEWKTISLGFILFRLFDIFKPYPISWVDQHIKGGYGMMLDDILAALLSILVLYPITLWMS